MGLNIKGRWTLGGTLPGEPRQPVELGLGAPKTGLWLREDVDMKVNFMMTKFVKANTKKAHSTLVDRLVERAHLVEAHVHNSGLAEQLSLRDQYPPDYHSGIVSPEQQSSQFFDGKPLTVPGASSPPLPQHPSNYNMPQDPGMVPHHGMAKSPGYVGRTAYPGMPQSYFPPQTHGQPDRRQSYNRVSLAESHNSYGGAAANHQNPAVLNTNNFAVEMPTQDSKTPIELDNSRR